MSTAPRPTPCPARCREEVKEERYDRLHGSISRRSAPALLAERVGKTIEVIVDEVDEDGAIARSAWDAPEIDGNVYLNGETGLAAATGPV